MVSLGGRFGKALFDVTQQARIGWFGSQYALAQFLAPPLDAPVPEPGSMPSWQYIREDLNRLLARDWQYIDDGLYKAPEDLLPNPFHVAKRSFQFLRDLPAINQQRRGRYPVSPPNHDNTGYPDYYLQNFHFQSDGYLSDHSAELYDYQVEVLFTGGADAMRRQTLPAIRDALINRTRPSPVLLDVACGTGSYLRSVWHNWPNLAMIGLDLSPDYLQHAEKRLRRAQKVDFLHANAESLPLADESIDIITCIYLFHELPDDVRRRVAGEMIRVLRPGGRLIFMDSIQLGDHAPYDALLDRFPYAFHEPYYRSYIRDDLDALFVKAGVKELVRERAFFSTLWVFEKPA